MTPADPSWVIASLARDRSISTSRPVTSERREAEPALKRLEDMQELARRPGLLGGSG